MNILSNLPELIQGASVALTVITLVATLLVRLTPSKRDDECVSKLTCVLMGVLHWLPTIGINPQTKKLEEAIESLKAEQPVVVVVTSVPVEPT